MDLPLTMGQSGIHHGGPLKAASLAFCCHTQNLKENHDLESVFLWSKFYMLLLFSDE